MPTNCPWAKALLSADKQANAHSLTDRIFYATQKKSLVSSTSSRVHREYADDNESERQQE